MDKKKVHLVIVTPYSKFFEDDVDFVVLPTSQGENGILANHIPIVTAIYPGSLRLRQGDRWSYAFVSNGYAQVGQDYTVVICNAAEWASDIDVQRAKANIEKNLRRIENLTEKDEINLRRYKHAIRRNKNRVHIAQKYGKVKAE